MVDVNMCSRRAAPYVSPIADTSLYIEQEKIFTILARENNFWGMCNALNLVGILCKQSHIESI